MGALVNRLAEWQDPRYTGPNRCVPCTAANTAIAILVALVVAGTGVLTDRPVVGAFVGQGVLLASAATIYFKGYLVPGTPTLTRRYFPDWLLARFDKAPRGPVAESGVAAGSATNEPTAPDDRHDVDVESRLLAAGVLEPDQASEDLRLTEEFSTAWDEAVGHLDGDEPDRERLLGLLDLGAGDVEVEEYDDAFQVLVDGRLVGRWESEAAFRADVATGEVLAERLDDWPNLPVGGRGSLLNGVRLFLERCPTCGGGVSMATDTVESCCREVEVAALTCDVCGARLFESGPLDG